MSFLFEKVNKLGLLLVVSVVALGGCQSVPSQRISFADSEQVMPGEIVRENYRHVLNAIRMFDAALAGSKTNLSGVVLDHAVEQSATLSMTNATGQLRQLAESEFMADGPYEFIKADAHNGRLEYGSLPTGERLSITVRAPTIGEKNEGKLFVVTNVFSQISLAKLASAKSFKPTHESAASSVLQPALRQVTQIGARDDAALLAYFNALPLVERDRVDLLGLRALLMMRLGNDDQAGPLVEQGIVRYPDASMFLAMAGMLFERATSQGAPASLTALMQSRFQPKEMSNARKFVQGLLNSPVLF